VEAVACCSAMSLGARGPLFLPRVYGVRLDHVGIAGLGHKGGGGQDWSLVDAAVGTDGEVPVDISREEVLRAHGEVGMSVSVGDDADDCGIVAGAGGAGTVVVVVVDGHGVAGIAVDAAAAGDDAQALVSEEYAILEDTAS
jgi:hypothetical protein